MEGASPAPRGFLRLARSWQLTEECLMRREWGQEIWQGLPHRVCLIDPSAGNASTNTELLRGEAEVWTSVCGWDLDRSPGTGTGSRPADLGEAGKELGSWFQGQSAADTQPTDKQPKPPQQHK